MLKNILLPYPIHSQTWLNYIMDAHCLVASLKWEKKTLDHVQLFYLIEFLFMCYFLTSPAFWLLIMVMGLFKFFFFSISIL